MSCKDRYSLVGIKANPQCISSGGPGTTGSGSVRPWIARGMTPEQVVTRMQTALDEILPTKTANYEPTPFNGDLQWRVSAAYKLSPMLVSYCIDLYQFSFRAQGPDTR